MASVTRATIIRAISAVSAVSMALALVGCSGSDSGDADTEGNTPTDNEFLSASTCNPALANGAVNKWDKGLLNTIATTEGTRGHGQDGYNVTFAYHYFSSCDRHPNLNICSGGYCSTAAGRYQFLTTTWNGLKLPNFHPNNQDVGAMRLVSRRGASIPSTRALTATEFVNVMDRISYEWASLPPGRYGQPSYSMTATRAKYCSFVSCSGSSSSGGGSSGAGCHSDTLGKDMAMNACVQSKFDKKWYQCDNGAWVDRWSDPAACSSVHGL